MHNYGYEPHLPVSLMSPNAVPAAHDYVRSMSRLIMQARACHRRATARQKRYYDKGHVHVEFQPDDWVLLNSKNLKFKVGMPKLLPRYVGPFQVKKRVGKVAYELIIPQRWRIHDVFHVSLLEPYHKDGIYQPPPPAELLAGELEYEVEAILEHKDELRKKHPKKFTRTYRVHWRGCDPERSTWEPAVNLRNASDTVLKYWVSLGYKTIPKEFVLEQLVTAPQVLQEPEPPKDTPGISQPTHAFKRRQRRRLARLLYKVT